MKKYTVTGMSCSACSARVEKAVSETEGVTSCSVNLLTGSMTVEGTASDEVIISAVEKAGYSASAKNAEKNQPPRKKRNSVKPRLIGSAVLLIVLMYISMGHMMFSLPLPAFFNDNPLALGITQMLLSGLILVINQHFFISGFKGIVNKSPNMDTLVSLGSGVSYIYSVILLLKMTASSSAEAMEYAHNLYFESAAMILVLITVGKMLEEYAKGKTSDAVKALMDLAPEKAIVEKDGKETEIPASEVMAGDVFIVRSGDSVPADGIITEGSCCADESALTGESIPVDKNVGDHVSCASHLYSGYIKCRAEKVGEDTLLSKIIQLVDDANATKAPIARIADKVSGVFVPCVIGIALITFIIWMLLGESISFALARGISVLVISCPCALGLATPVAIMAGSGLGARNGILFKNAAILEYTGEIKNAVFDKTGTITSGNPSVTDIISCEDTNEQEFLSFAYSLEKKSEHPLAQAIVKKAEEQGCTLFSSENPSFLQGSGLTAEINGEIIVGGNSRLIEKYADIPSNMLKISEKLSSEGKTPVYFSKGNKLLGIIAIADTIKTDSSEAIADLKQMGIHTVMLTGDNKATAEAVAKKVGVDEIIAGVLPDGKEDVIRKLQALGKTAMIGDGINDSPALARADVGIAIGGGADIAIKSSDAVLVNNTLSDIPAAVRLSRKVIKNIKENLFWAFFYNVICIPLAAGVWIYPFNLKLNPMIAAGAMSLSSLCVVLNALRLNLYKVKNKKEIKTMEKTMKISGMMCSHCEARVKSSLEAVDGVLSVDASSKNGTAVIKLAKDVPFEVLKETVEKQGYTVIE